MVQPNQHSVPSGATYARGTKIQVAQTKVDVETLLRRRGATELLMGFSDKVGCELIQFKLGVFQIRFYLPMFRLEDFANGPRGQKRTTQQQEGAFEQAQREQWRATLGILRMHFVMIDLGAILEDSFFAHVVNPETGKTVEEEVGPDIWRKYNVPPERQVETRKRFLLEGSKG